MQARYLEQGDMFTYKGKTYIVKSKRFTKTRVIIQTTTGRITLKPDTVVTVL